MRCTDCFYCEWDNSDEQGFCHRYPPQILGNVVIYPIIDADDWCGEIIPIVKEMH